MRDDFRRLAHAGLTFNAPLSEERASALVSALPISPGHHVLDLGCGWGELLLRILAAHPATTGTGVDTDREALDRGVRAATRRGLHGRVEFIQAPAETFVDVADIVVCVASSHAFGGTGDALDWLRQSVAPGGRVLFGDGFWAAEPSAAALDDDRRAAPPRRAPCGHGGGRLPDRARRGLRPRRVGRVRIGLAVGPRDVDRRRRRWRSRRSAAASTRTATARRSASAWLVLAPV